MKIEDVIAHQLLVSVDEPFTSIPYKGGGAACIDLLGGQVQVMIDALQQSMPHIKS